MKRADAWSASEAKHERGRSRPLVLPAGVKKDKMEAAASQKPQPSERKHDGAVFVELERHATASVTQIFYITHCVTEIIEPR